MKEIDNNFKRKYFATDMNSTFVKILFFPFFLSRYLYIIKKKDKHLEFDIKKKEKIITACCVISCIIYPLQINILLSIFFFIIKQNQKIRLKIPINVLCKKIFFLFYQIISLFIKMNVEFKINKIPFNNVINI